MGKTATKAVNKDLEKPTGLSKQGEAAYEAIMGCLGKHGLTDTGGCKAFYSPQQWKERGEDYGTESVLVVVHDGGAHAPCFSYDYQAYALIDEMAEVLKAHGLFVEQCTGWYSAVYTI